MVTQLYFGGLPTGPELRKLHEAFPDLASLRGTMITHEQLEPIVGAIRKSNRYRTILSRWRKQIEKATGIVIDGTGEAQGVGFMVLADSDQVHFGVNKRKQAQRKIRRWHSSVANVNEEKLTSEERRIREHEMFAAGKIHAALMETRRPIPRIAPPEVQPKSASTIVQ